jgi:hypothetical protein
MRTGVVVSSVLGAVVALACIDVGHEAEVGCLADMTEPGCVRQVDAGQTQPRDAAPDVAAPDTSGTGGGAGMGGAAGAAGIGGAGGGST